MGNKELCTRGKRIFSSIKQLKQSKRTSTSHHIIYVGTTWVLGFSLSETSIENHYNVRRNRHAGNRLLYKDPIPQPSTCSLTESSSKPVEPSSLPHQPCGSTSRTAVLCSMACREL